MKHSQNVQNCSATKDQNILSQTWFLNQNALVFFIIGRMS